MKNISFIVLIFLLFSQSSAQHVLKPYPPILFNNLNNEVAIDLKSYEIAKLRIKAFDSLGNTLKFKFIKTSNHTLNIIPKAFVGHALLKFKIGDTTLLTQQFEVAEFPAPRLYLINDDPSDENLQDSEIYDDLITHNKTFEVKLEYDGYVNTLINPQTKLKLLRKKKYSIIQKKLFIENDTLKTRDQATKTITDTVKVENLIDQDLKLNLTTLKEYFTENVYAIQLLMSDLECEIAYPNGLKKRIKPNLDHFKTLTICKDQKSYIFEVKGIFTD